MPMAGTSATANTSLSFYDAFVTVSGQVGDGTPGLGIRGWGTTRFMGHQFDWKVEFIETLTWVLADHRRP